MLTHRTTATTIALVLALTAYNGVTAAAEKDVHDEHHAGVVLPPPLDTPVITTIRHLTGSKTSTMPVQYRRPIVTELTAKRGSDGKVYRVDVRSCRLRKSTTVNTNNDAVSDGVPLDDTKCLMPVQLLWPDGLVHPAFPCSVGVWDLAVFNWIETLTLVQ